MATISLNSSLTLASFNPLIAEYRASLTNFQNNILSAFPKDAKYSSNKITGTLSTGEIIEIQGKFGYEIANITKIIISNPAVNSKITLSMSWTINNTTTDYGMSTSYFTGYSYQFINSEGKTILVTESFDHLYLNNPLADLTHYTFSITDGLGGSISLATDSLPIATYSAMNKQTSFDAILSSIQADGSIFSGNDIVNTSKSLEIQTINGYSGDDNLTGSNQNDTLDGGTGKDTLKGQLGDDTYYIDNIDDKVIESANQGNDTIYTSVTLKTIKHIENFIATGSDAINLLGNTLSNSLQGNHANNLLDGGKEADTMRGGEGDDTYKVDHIGDRVIEESEAGKDTIITTVNYTLSENVEDLTLTGKALSATGNTLINTLTGNSGKNILDGKEGADIMIGGTGNDTYYVDNADDIATELLKGGIDTVVSSVDFSLKDTELENITLIGSATQATGNAFNNILIANDHGNTLNGGAGNDTLKGGHGEDILTGGTGADRFILSASSNDTIITDFSKLEKDKIDLKAIDANTATTKDDKFSFINWSTSHSTPFETFSKAGELVIFSTEEDGIWVVGNTDTDFTTAEVNLFLVGVTISSLSASDFML